MTNLRARLSLLFALAAIAAFASAGIAQASNPGVDPNSVTVTLSPGASTTVNKVVHTPPIPPKPDVFFLSDTTGSMGPTIANVQANISNIMSTVLTAQSQSEFGAGQYKDQLNCSFDPFSYNLDQAITANTAAVQAAMGTWSASGGCDTPESQLYALQTLASSAATGFRPGSTRIVVWFGDSNGHDPDGPATLASTIAALQAANIKVIAIPVNSGGGNGLDNGGQATAIVTATGGVLLPSATPAQVSSAILTGLTNLPVTVTPQLGTCDPQLSVGWAPPSQTVTSGDDAAFTETIGLAATAPDGTTYHCTVYWTLNGSIVTNDDGTPDAAYVQTITVPVEAPTVATYTGPSNEDFNDSVTLSGTLTKQSDGSAVAGETLTFTLGSQSCNGITDATGAASCSFVINQAPGASSVVVSFAGDGLLLPSTTTAPFTINQEESALSSTTSLQLFAQGGTANLSATLFDPEDNIGIAGKTVTITLGSGSGAQSCSATTDASGVANCSISPVTVGLGPQPVTDSFAGDTYYVPSSNDQQALVFAYLAQGSFVIGDKNAAVGTDVTFWGSQWWKLNGLSGGTAPAAFKGFESSLTMPACGQTWTTQPGNSSGPPSSVPSYMAVVVSTSISQSGSTISGDVHQVVIVETGSGYAANPGHAGTGTVVAVLCTAP